MYVCMNECVCVCVYALGSGQEEEFFFLAEETELEKTYDRFYMTDCVGNLQTIPSLSLEKTTLETR